MATAYVCDCGEIHRIGAREGAEIDRLIELAGDRLIDVRLPDGRVYRVPRVYGAFHGLRAVDVPDLARRYGWALAISI